ncbi:MAG: NYN domain-containing protein [Candidatus Omnitrophica bacterium]|nr:NYN domain-containing protein [Candidatus Omnitrophota bacterium]MDE2009196.1 NYN domain-containing protein [Candidatus Omnitrophota bacterium]MDE2213717.1 NYN domain-containing protein [Candidatus Omnitrophota bacterium]MDE2230708.1 NYN domain-containing protein [Candidatus Omnitrophota bacterium]
MSLHYLLDGYNILKQVPDFDKLPLEEGRRALLKWIDTARPQGSVNNKVTVVFDGHSDQMGSMLQQEIRVIFSQGSADDAIKRMVREDQEIKTCVVVSDDKDIFLYARSLGARVMKVAAFTKGTASCFSRGEFSSGGSAAKNISLIRQEMINKELRRLWLKEK